MENQNKKWIEDTWRKIQTKLSSVAVKSRDKIPYTAVDGVHDNRADNGYWWTNGFWGGLMWLMYSATGDEAYKLTAKRITKDTARIPIIRGRVEQETTLNIRLISAEK